jgi:hypothetical protein
MGLLSANKLCSGGVSGAVDTLAVQLESHAVSLPGGPSKQYCCRHHVLWLVQQQQQQQQGTPH